MIKTLKEINLEHLIKERRFTPSPAAWEDQVIYFLLLDRFSDGNEAGYGEGRTPLFSQSDWENAMQTESDAKEWKQAGRKWVGGNMKGLLGKLDYLKGLGVTVIWISPLFKQVAFQETYHGYGIQNFLEVDPHFGTAEDLKSLVESAHEKGMYVIMDIILNHSGDVFSYKPGLGRGPFGEYCWDGKPYEVQGFNDKYGNPTIPFYPIDLEHDNGAWPDGAVWPVEFQEPSNFSQKGFIRDWENDPEYFEGDFFDLKDIKAGDGILDAYRESPALRALCKVYRYWMVFADIDGYRVDTVKHMDPGAVRYFANDIHEFAQVLGKENFYLIGEVTGGREHAFHTLELTGLDAALGIEDIPDKLEQLAKGQINPHAYFSLFRNSLLVNKKSHTWFKNKVVTLFDDHDQVRKIQYKARFCANGSPEQVLNALALNVTTLGIPCVYYGTEQCFDGQGDNDSFIREAMFGGCYGAFRSKGRHFFNQDGWVYKELARILEIRKESLTLRRGRQYLRPVSSNGIDFSLPKLEDGRINNLVAWSRIFYDTEVILLMNTDFKNTLSAWVTVDNGLHGKDDKATCIYSSLDRSKVGKITDLEKRNGKSVLLTAMPWEFAIYTFGKL